jgi:hypothetical protein
MSCTSHVFHEISFQICGEITSFERIKHLRERRKRNMNGNQEYDAIWLGGGAGGRFGAAFHKALGGRPLIIEKCHLGGQ